MKDMCLDEIKVTLKENGQKIYKTDISFKFGETCPFYRLKTEDWRLTGEGNPSGGDRTNLLLGQE